MPTRDYGEAQCAVCGKTFTKRSKNAIYCGNSCYMVAQKRIDRGVPVGNAEYKQWMDSHCRCEMCGTPIVYARNRKYCASCLRIRRLKQDRRVSHVKERSDGLTQLERKMRRSTVTVDSYIPVRRISDSM
jgi:hypothetical protein